MPEWSLLTNHSRALVCIAHDPGVRLRDIASTLAITERSAFGIVTDLIGAGYVIKEKDGRRNRYRIQTDLPLREKVGREQTIGELLAALIDPRVADEATSRQLSGERVSDDVMGDVISDVVTETSLGPLGLELA